MMMCRKKKKSQPKFLSPVSIELFHNSTLNEGLLFNLRLKNLKNCATSWPALYEMLKEVYVKESDTKWKFGSIVRNKEL